MVVVLLALSGESTMLLTFAVG